MVELASDASVGPAGQRQRLDLIAGLVNRPSEVKLHWLCQSKKVRTDSTRLGMTWPTHRPPAAGTENSVSSLSSSFAAADTSVASALPRASALMSSARLR